MTSTITEIPNQFDLYPLRIPFIILVYWPNTFVKLLFTIFLYQIQNLNLAINVIKTCG